MNNSFKILDWDSAFFGFKVGEMNYSSSSILRKSLIQHCDEGSAQLIYLRSKKAICDLDQLEHYALSYSGVKLVYTKFELTRFESSQVKCNEANRGISMDSKLTELAIESGVYSRFNKDSFIETSKFRSLYATWIAESVKRRIADKVFVTMDGEVITGFVTVKLKDSKAVIGLIAVDSSYRGGGIAKSLLRCVENWCFDKNVSLIEVATQYENKAARGLYESCYFRQTAAEHIYHLWRKNRDTF